MSQNPAKILLFVIFLSLPAYSSFSSDLDTLALSMAKELKLSPSQPLSITTITFDKNYMLGLNGIFKKLKERLAPFAKDVKFNSVEGDDIVRTIIMSSDFAPIPVNDRKADSLLMTGYYKLIDNDSSRVYFHIKVVDWNSQTLFESDPITINSADCPPAVKLDVFDFTSNPMKRGEIEYRGRIINDFDALFYHTPNNLLANPAQYRFVNEHPYAFPWQLELLKDILLRRYGITLCDNCPAGISVVQSGSIIFSRDGKQYSRARLVDGEALLPDSFPEEKDSYHYINTSVSNSEQNVRVENKPFSTNDEKEIRDKIYRIFNEEYPKLFNPFNYDKLNAIFLDKNHPNILIGKVDKEDAVTGKEIVKYSWITKKQWLDNLKSNAEKKQQTFRISTSVMGVFNDNLDNNRYWAIVKQKWESVDLLGHVTYTDNGFLFVNFDFTDSNELKEFKIHYRLWFNDYKYDDVELGIKRYQKLENDIRSYFENGMSGIDSSLKKGMREFLIQKVKARGSLNGSK
jgi:hypothetical protein